ncbi:MAG TPA: IclR family transcriptional regulator [Polyangiaceae bacterium]|nr:IclR family transcriptional regulator [Polyangiaceae bacterium]
MERSGTLDKAVRVLRALERAERPLALAALASSTTMPKPTLHRLLSSLAAHDLVEQDGEGRYGLGVGLVRLGLGALAVDPFVRVARVELERAARAFGETFFLVGARAGRLVVLDKVEGTGLLRAAPSVGAEVPIELTASGRLFAGLAPDALADGARARRVSKRAVERALERGYDLNEGEWIDGLMVIAAPVVVSGRLYGTVACAGAVAQLSGSRKEEAVQRTRKLAERIGRALGARREEGG